MTKNSTKDDLLDLAGNLISGKKVDTDDLIDLVTGSGSSKKKKSNSDSILDKLLGKNEYPAMSAKNYWALRKKFQRSIPDEVTAASIASSLDIKTATVKESILPALQKMKLISANGTPKSLMTSWTDDDKYESACKDICEDVYPSSVRNLGYKTKTDQRSILSWFKKNSDATETKAKQMMAIYLLLRDPEVKDSSSSSSSSSSSEKSSSDASGKKITVTKTKTTNKATVKLQFTVDQDITQTALKSIFNELFEATAKKL